MQIYIQKKSKDTDPTLAYYDQNASNFIKTTQSVDFHEIQDLFLTYLPRHASILDLGCGSGRDAKYFKEQGYKVTASDGSKMLCKAAEEYSGISVRHQFFLELDDVEKYDGIWACASILHLQKAELPEMLQKIYNALKKDGIFYTSFKYGDFEGVRNGRHFSDFTEESILKLINQIEGLKTEKLWLTEDARKDRKDEKWLNIILRKTDK